MNARNIRRLLVGILGVTMAAIVLSILFHQSPMLPTEKSDEKFAPGIKSVVKNPEIKRFKDEKAVDVAKGEEMSVDEEGRVHYKNLHETHKMDDGREVTIKADEAILDERTLNFQANGHVEVMSSDGYRLAGTKLERKTTPGKKEDVYESNDPIEFSKPGVSGTAAFLRADLESRVFDLWGGVAFIVDNDEGEEKTYINGPSVHHEERAGHAVFPEGAMVTKGEGFLTGKEIEAFFKPAPQKGLAKLVARGDVRVDFTKEAPPATPAAPKSKPLSSAFAGVDHLTADEVTVMYAETGREIERVIASRVVGPVTVVVAPESPADPPRSLTANAVEVGYQDGDPREVLASGEVLLEIMPHGAEPGRTVKSGEAHAMLEGGDLRDVRFHQAVVISEPGRTARSEAALFTQATDVVVLEKEGDIKPEVDDGESILKAERIESRSKEGVLLADGDIELTYVERKDPAAAPKPTAGGSIQGMLGKSGEPVRVLGEKMKSTGKGADTVFTGNVRLWKADNVIEAPKITVRRDANELYAENGVKASFHGGTALPGMEKPPAPATPPEKVTPPDTPASPDKPPSDDAEPLHVDSQTLTLDDGNHRMFVESAGGSVVRLRQGTATVTGKSATFDLDPDTSKVKAAKVVGSVTIVDGARQGSGAIVEFDMLHGRKVVLRGEDGKVAQMQVGPKGSTRGEELIFYLDEDTVSVAGGRVDTTIAIDGPGGTLGSGREKNPPR
ncbi:MAG: hypothetical protein U0166_12965 [Acidobacteriota bacterium]